MKIQKLKNNKYKIKIDNIDIITYDNIILENNLLYKKEISENLYNKLLKDNTYYDLYNNVLKYLLKKKRSEKEVFDYISKLTNNINDIESIINKLKKINLINDIEFCKAFINDKIYLSKIGINKIKMELLEHNIPIDVIDDELKNIDENIFFDRLSKIVEKKIKANKKYSKKQLSNKILNEMIILGYNKESIIKVLDSYLIEDESVINKEFDRLYNKLRSKYSEKELYISIKNKLFQKGFNIEEINCLIEKKQRN